MLVELEELVTVVDGVDDEDDVIIVEPEEDDDDELEVKLALLLAVV